MKSSVINQMTLEELRDKLSEEKDRLSKLKISHSVSPLENPSSIKIKRRLISRIHTILREKEAK